ncbi:LPP20 family lipoprotein [bacterium]|nr:LPP20 family lipoprotein [bacterium]
MKRYLGQILFYSFVALLSFSLMSNDAMAQKKKKKKKKNSTPEWINKPGLYEDVIVAAGVGEGTSENIAISRSELDGRKQIAATLGTEIKSLSTNFMEEASTTTEEGESGAAQQYFSEITTGMTKQYLEGSKAEEYWPGRPLEKGTNGKYKVYAKMVLKKSVLIDEYKKQMADGIAKKKIAGVKASAEDALGALDKAIEKWEKTSNNGPISSDEGEEAVE